MKIAEVAQNFMNKVGLVKEKNNLANARFDNDTKIDREDLESDFDNHADWVDNMRDGKVEDIKERGHEKGFSKNAEKESLTEIKKWLYKNNLEKDLSFEQLEADIKKDFAYGRKEWRKEQSELYKGLPPGNSWQKRLLKEVNRVGNGFSREYESTVIHDWDYDKETFKEGRRAIADEFKNSTEVRNALEKHIDIPRDTAIKW